MGSHALLVTTEVKLTSILILIFVYCFILLGKQEDDNVPGRSSTRVCKPPGGGSSLSLS